MNTRKTQLSFPCIAILGPTASGKSDVAIQLAQKYNGEVISCDSRQVYRHMDIGTGKVLRDATTKGSTFLSEGIVHHMIDIVSPNTDYNVAKFQKRANRSIREIQKQKKIPILCGGTGLWAQALIEDFSFPSIPPNQTLRKELQQLSLGQLQEKLLSLDKRSYETIDKKNPVRLIRAIERHLSVPISTPIKTKESSPLSWHIIVISPPKEILYQNIEKRLDQRLKEGMIDEVSTLHSLYRVPWSRMERFGLEYRWASRYLRKKISYKDMRENLLLDSRHYAKRQLTWLKRWERMGREISWVENKEKAIQRGLMLMKNIQIPPPLKKED